MAVKYFVGVTPADEPDDFPEPEPVEGEVTKYVVEVIRQKPIAKDVYRGTRVIETVRTEKGILNIGAGPELPEHPYEGQVWILT
jgi:hypothetical protein